MLLLLLLSFFYVRLFTIVTIRTGVRLKTLQLLAQTPVVCAAGPGPDAVGTEREPVDAHRRDLVAKVGANRRALSALNYKTTIDDTHAVFVIIYRNRYC